MDASRVLVLSAAIVLLAACASTSKSDYASTSTRKAGSGEVDVEYMSRVERGAAQVGVEVIWINPPKARKSGSGG